MGLCWDLSDLDWDFSFSHAQCNELFSNNCGPITEYLIYIDIEKYILVFFDYDSLPQPQEESLNLCYFENANNDSGCNVFITVKSPCQK